MTAPHQQPPCRTSAPDLAERVRHLEEKVRLYEAVLATGPVLAHVHDRVRVHVTGEVQREEEVETSRRLLAALLDTLDEAVVGISDGRIAFANARIRDFFPDIESPHALIGRSTGDVQRAFAEAMADPATFIASAQRMVADGEVVRDRVVETADGRILEQHYLPVGAGEHARRMWVYRDVTAQLNLERRQQRVLQRERAARQSAEEQNNRLRELDELKTAFVATVSHELRTPLSALRSYIDLLLDPQGETLSDEQRGLAEGVRRGALRLGRLVEDLLVLAQLQTGSLPVERTIVAVPDAVADAVEEVRRAAPADVVITERLDTGPPTATDRLRLTQIVSNLVGNAAKFAAAEVRCTAVARDGHWVIEITDDGPGIAPEERERVFEPFYRGRAGGRVREGTGLGLPISVQLAELLQSELTVENDTFASGVVARLTVPIVGGDDDGAD